MSNMVINVIHKPVSLASSGARLQGKWHCRKWAGPHPIRCGAGSSGSFVGHGRALTLQVLFQMEKRKKTRGTQSPWQTVTASGVFAGPQAGVQPCPACPPYLLGGAWDTLFSSSSFGCTVFPREPLGGCWGPSWNDRVPGSLRSQPGTPSPGTAPSVAHMHCPWLPEGGPWPLLGTMDEW